LIIETLNIPSLGRVWRDQNRKPENDVGKKYGDAMPTSQGWGRTRFDWLADPASAKFWAGTARGPAGP